nr:MAG: capsid protein [Cressdnaviricota sp.]
MPLKSFRKRTIKKPRYALKKFSKKLSFANKCQAIRKSKKSPLKSIKVKSDGICVTYNSISNKIDNFQKSLARKYNLGSKNVSQQVYCQKMTTPGNSLQYAFGFSLFDGLTTGSMATALVVASLSPGNNGNVVNTARTFWTKLTSEYLMTNSSNGVAFVDIYTFKTKDDGSNSPLQLWNSAIQDETQQTSINYTTYYGVSPLDSTCEINSYFTCKQITHITLLPGQVHRFMHTIHKNLPMENIRIKDSQYMRGWSEYDLFVLRGAPCTASTNSLIAAELVNLDVIQTEKYEFKYIVDQNCNYGYSIPTAFGTIGNIYNQGSGASVASTVI